MASRAAAHNSRQDAAERRWLPSDTELFQVLISSRLNHRVVLDQTIRTANMQLSLTFRCVHFLQMNDPAVG